MKLKYALYILYTSLVIYLVFSKGGNYTRSFQPFSFDRPINLVPFESKMPYLKRENWLQQNDWFYFFREVIGNIFLLFPLPFFLYYGEGKRNNNFLLLVCLLTSVSIELLQYLSGLGEADIDDVLLNGGGAILALITISAIQFLRTVYKGYFA